MKAHDHPDLSGMRDEPRRKLVRAAADVFAEVGYDAATVRIICARAGVNTAAVNYHFGDKLTLFRATLQFAMATEKTPEPLDDLASIPAEKALRAYLLRSFAHFGEMSHPAMYTRVMMQELMVPSKALETAASNILRPRIMVLAEIAGRILELPSTHPQTRLAVHSILGQVLYYILARPLLTALWPELHMDPAQMNEIINYIADFSLAALQGGKRG